MNEITTIGGMTSASLGAGQGQAESGLPTLPTPRHAAIRDRLLASPSATTEGGASRYSDCAGVEPVVTHARLLDGRKLGLVDCHQGHEEDSA